MIYLNDAVSRTDYVASNDKIIIELENAQVRSRTSRLVIRSDRKLSRIAVSAILINSDRNFTLYSVTLRIDAVL
jgi:hypothetical protein